MADVPATTVLVHSPYLGPASLRPLAGALAELGHPVVLLDLRVTVNAAPVHQRLLGVFADAVEDSLVEGDLVLVGHSGAGPLLPAFADALETPVRGLVFLDADLPTPGRSWRDDAPAERMAHLKTIARDGLMPRWDLWFAPEALSAMVPDVRLLEEIVAEAPEVPLAFLKEPRPTVAWTGPCSYVRLSPAYDSAASAARELGWPVVEVDSHHLGAVTSPEVVAEALVPLLSRW
ncbi:thioesterase domain-containing protein [Saccharothrix carnea]|uniref:Thioesterase domain-containing protein n=1 Tax=Saccharothrix carnea TaxID=1280637 RepID=A0A2P8II69_SACCR|nr:alpha/beta fold hydrolase [Saccharothrix carnea]PSL58163.1 thioesterase domain-containing protein [Saccharothrix carnea]